MTRPALPINPKPRKLPNPLSPRRKNWHGFHNGFTDAATSRCWHKVSSKQLAFAGLLALVREVP